MKTLAMVMESLGFWRSTGRHFVNPDTPYYVEFPTGPLTVGDRPVKQTARLQTPLGTVRMLTPAQCVMDQLAAFYHWKDRQGLDQARMVARRQPVDLADVGRGPVAEGKIVEFAEFLRGLEVLSQLES